MSQRSTLNCLAITLAGLVMLASSPTLLAAQGVPDTAKKATQKAATSEKRIKMQKDVEQPKTTSTSGGEVALTPACSCNQDSISAVITAREGEVRADQRRLDSIAAAARLQSEMDRMRADAAAARERARLDSIAGAEAAALQAQLALRRQLARGWYVGVAAGASTPDSYTQHSYGGGWNTTVPFGYDVNDSPIGFRGDFSLDRFTGVRITDANTQTIAANGSVSVWSFNADLKLRTHAPGASPRSNIYALGGVGVHRLSGGVYGLSGANAGQRLSFGDAGTHLGWNAGAGVSTGWGPAEIFVESRYMWVKSDMPYRGNNGIGNYTQFMPIVVGLNFF